MGNNRITVLVLVLRNTMDKKIVLFALLGLIVASSEALFFGVPRSSCRYDNQCRLRKCVNRGNIFCGAGNFFGRLFHGRRSRQRRCDWNECAECTQDYHCSSYERCSSYSCTAKTTTESPFLRRQREKNFG